MSRLTIGFTFLSTLSLRRATSIPITGFLERDFYPRSPCGERQDINVKDATARQFLSTLSLRRATSQCRTLASGIYDFYPRSPCGERPHDFAALHNIFISIHALLAESDVKVVEPGFVNKLFLSTLSLRRATYQQGGERANQSISIHALLAESDCAASITPAPSRNFYPRSPCGERQPAEHHANSQQEFLSTLSLRRATQTAYFFLAGGGISIHALLAESDRNDSRGTYPLSTFLSTLSLRRATGTKKFKMPVPAYFYPRSPCGERLCECWTVQNRLSFLSTLSLRRATVHFDNFNLHCVISIHALLAESDDYYAI